MSSLPQFTICCMNGSAMGGGFGLVCACDYVIATKQAKRTRRCQHGRGVIATPECARVNNYVFACRSESG